jgi:hypothetical protein
MIVDWNREGAKETRGNVAAFVKLDWRRLDVIAIVANAGLAAVDERRHRACQSWLHRNGYEIDSFDCRPGLSAAIPELGRRLKWEQQFGYSLDAESRNLNALRDGFNFEIPKEGGLVFEIIRPDVTWQEDRQWMSGLLSIVVEQSRWQLALGRRFFGLLVLPEEYPLVGETIDKVKIPGSFWSPCREIHEFEH